MTASICKSCKVRPRAYRKEICDQCYVDKLYKARKLVELLGRLRKQMGAA